MTGFSIGEAYGAGFKLITGRPLSVLVWGLVYWLLNMIPVGLMLWLSGPELLNAWSEMMASAVAGEDPSSRLERMQSTMAGLQGFQGLGWLLGLLATGLINAAIFRAVLRPEDGGIFGLKLGMDEVWQALIELCINILLILIAIPFALVFVGVGVAVFFAMGQGVGGVMAGLLIGLIGVVLFLWIALRFSLAGPATFATRNFQLFESWTLTKGQGFQLLLLAILLGLTIFVLQLVLGFVFLIAFVSAGTLEALSPEAIEAFFTQPFETWSVQLLPWFIGASLIGALLTGALYTFLYAPFASVYRQLTEAQSA